VKVIDYNKSVLISIILVPQGDQFEAEIAPSKLVLFFDVSEDTLVKRCMKRAQIKTN
jgi:hypothetical protein